MSAINNTGLFEDLLALANKKYLASIKKAREEYRRGEFVTHQQASKSVKILEKMLEASLLLSYLLLLFVTALRALPWSQSCL